MSGWLYADYLEIDQQFIDVYTEEVDRQHARAWQSYIPQANTRKLLERIMEILERKSPKPPFIYGPYGTGKTFTAFLIKHLLEDDLEEVASFFAKYPSIKDLWPRWRALRERGPYVVVYRSSATDAGTPFRLAYIVQERVTKALEEKGYSARTTETIRQEVLQKLTDPQSTFNWPRAFEKYRIRFKEFMRPDEVIARLRDADSQGLSTEEGVLGLVERVVRTLEAEHFVVLHSAEQLKGWIKEVIAQNRLQGLVFLWDEFTDFFKIAGAPVDLVQELAHVAEEAPFYFGLITHLAPDIILKVDQTSRAKFLERFHRHHLELANVTAYRLMGAVLQVKPERAPEWERRRETLWNMVEKVSPLVIGLQGETKEDLCNIVPIHPYTALTLANIARTFSSSQRTLFRFLREERTDRFSFPRFLREHPNDRWYWLTADYLWDYFYTEDDPEYPEEVRRFISHYRANVEKIADEVERRVYKVVLLFDLLHRRLPVSEESRLSFEPTRSRVQRVFEGVLDRDRVGAALDSLCKRHLLQRYTVGQNEGYTLPLLGIDEKKIQEIKGKIGKTNDFRSLARDRGEFGALLASLLQLTPPLGLRQQLCTVATEEFLVRRERVLQQENLAPYQVGVVVVLPFEENEIVTASEMAKRLSCETPRLIYAVAEQEFGVQRWDRWLEQKALAEYAREMGEREGEQSHRERATELVVEWARDVIARGFQMHLHGRVVSIATKEGYEEFLEEAVEELYPLRPERIFTTETLYTGPAGKQAAEIGLGLVPKPHNPYAIAVDRLKREGLWDGEDWPMEHPLAQMKARIRNILEERGEMNLLETWKMLMGPPFGLMPSRIGVMLFGFLLREYTEGHYYWDGNRCEGLNAKTLATLVENVVKRGKDAEHYAIRRMLPAEEKACGLLREIFDLSPEETRYLRTALIALRNRFKNLGYPLWSLSYAGREPWPEGVLAGIQRLQHFMAADPEMGSWQQEQVEGLKNDLATLALCVTRDIACHKAHYETGMRRFFEQENRDLMEMASRLNLSMDRLMEKLRALLQEEVAFWDQAKVAQRLQQLNEECRVTIALNELIGCNARELSTALGYLRNEWVGRYGKLPLWLIADVAEGEVKEALSLLDELYEARDFNPAKDFEHLSNWAARSCVLEQRKELIRKNLGEQTAALLRWIRERLQVDILAEDVSNLLEKLPELCDARRQEVEDHVRRYLNELERRRLIAELRQRWQELTGTLTSGEWSQEVGIPAHFLVEKDLQQVLDIVDRPGDKSESQLRAALRRLDENAGVVSSLRDAGWVKKKFLERVVKDYAVLIEGDADLATLKEYLVQRLGPELSRWDLAHAQDLVREWAEEYYRQVGYQRVKLKLRELPAERVKALLEDLAKDPRVGILLLCES